MTGVVEVEQVRPSVPVMLAAMVGGFVAWAGRFALGYLFVPTACEVGAWLLHAVALVAIVLAVATIVLDVVLLRRPLDPVARFLLLGAAGINVFWLSVILLESSSALVVDACAKGAIP